MFFAVRSRITAGVCRLKTRIRAFSLKNSALICLADSALAAACVLCRILVSATKRIHFMQTAPVRACGVSLSPHFSGKNRIRPNFRSKKPRSAGFSLSNRQSDCPSVKIICTCGSDRKLYVSGRCPLCSRRSSSRRRMPLPAC